MTELMLIGQTCALLLTWQIQKKKGNFYQSLGESTAQWLMSCPSSSVEKRRR